MSSLPKNDPDAVVEFHRRLIQSLLESEKVVKALSGDPCRMGISLQEPDIRMRLVIDGARSCMQLVDPDDKTVDDPCLSMKWETALKFWLGDLDIMSAVLNRAIKIEGQNVDPLFRLKSVLNEARQASNEIVREFGWG